MLSQFRILEFKKKEFQRLSYSRASLTMSSTSNDQPVERANLGCGILGRYPIISVVSFAAIGVGVGIGLAAWDPEDSTTKENVLKWIGLIGDLFIRCLKAVVLPLVFCNVAVSVVDMMMMGRASSVGIKTIVLYVCTTLIASIIGLISILSFQSLFIQGDFDTQAAAFVSLGCTEEGSLLTEDPSDGTLMCMANGNETSPYTQFEINDITGVFARADGSSYAEISMSETVYSGVFLKLITDNIFYAFMDGNFASVIIFAIVFGIALGRIFFEQKDENDNGGSVTSTAQLVVHFLQGIGDILLRMINW